MTSYELLVVLEDLSKILSKPVLGVITSLGGMWREISNNLRESLTSPNPQPKIDQALGKVDEAIKYIRGQAPSLFVSDLLVLQDSVETVVESLNVQDREPLKRLSQLVGNFIRLYDAAMQSHSRADAVALMSCAADLNEVLDTSRRMVGFVKGRLSREVPLQDGFDRLVLFLDSENQAGVVADRIAAVSRVYERLCVLLDVPTREYPLTIQQGEVGSLFLVLMGNAVAIKLLSDLLKRALDFIYRSSNEGKLDSLPRRFEDIERFLKLRDELAKRGVKSERLDDDLLEAATTIGAGMTRLFQQTMKVSVDGEVHEVPSKFRERLESAERRLLGAPDNEEGTNHPKSDPEKSG